MNENRHNIMYIQYLFMLYRIAWDEFSSEHDAKAVKIGLTILHNGDGI